MEETRTGVMRLRLDSYRHFNRQNAKKNRGILRMLKDWKKDCKKRKAVKLGRAQQQESQELYRNIFCKSLILL